MRRLSRKTKQRMRILFYKWDRQRLKLSIKKKHQVFLDKLKKQDLEKEEKKKAYRRISHKRKEIINALYDSYSFKEAPSLITINGNLGIEQIDGYDRFFSLARSLHSFDSRTLTIDLSSVDRIWPSGITMLCALKKWLELTCYTRHKKEPQILPIKPNDNGVEAYLNRCGFYDYLRTKTKTQSYKTHSSHDDSYAWIKDKKKNPALYFPPDLVKIRRIAGAYHIKQRETCEKLINELLATKTNYNQDELGFFSDVILVEILSNVQEHGLTCARDKGWFVLAQHHPTHEFISLCIADNGIGIENSLITGPQTDEIRNDLKQSFSVIDHASYIVHATKENVSGAVNASLKETELAILERHPRGNRRGNGLGRVIKRCKQLNIILAIISHKGACVFHNNGSIIKKESSETLLLGGTMYHMLIPCNGGSLR